MISYSNSYGDDSVRVGLLNRDIPCLGSFLLHNQYRLCQSCSHSDLIKGAILGMPLPFTKFGWYVYIYTQSWYRYSRCVTSLCPDPESPVPLFQQPSRSKIKRTRQNPQIARQPCPFTVSGNTPPINDHMLHNLHN